VTIKQSSLYDAVVEALDAPVDAFSTYDVVLVRQSCQAADAFEFGYAWRSY
jgi:hypothetical protein